MASTVLYEPLTNPSDFRLLLLKPGKGEDPLVSELEKHSLDAYQRPYTGRAWIALSYTWGSPHWRGNLLCNGVQVSITRNLHSALWGLRRPDKAILVWADAICINQDDRVEKEAQVRLMRRIYSSAYLVVADLGQAGEDYDDVCSIVNALSDIIKRTDESEQIYPEKYESYGLPSITDPKWQSFHRFLARPWFTRVWVQQEFAVAYQVNMMYGTDQLAGEFIPHLVSQSIQRGLTGSILDDIDNSKVRRAANDGSLAMNAMLVARQEQQTDKTNGLFHHLRYLSAYCQASDDRDKVYALLGLATDAERSAIRVDYTESVAEVYHRIARYFIEQREGVKILYEAGCCSYLDNLPSWAPNWAGDRLAESWGLSENLSWAKEGKGMYRATRSTGPQISLDADHRKLRIRGRYVCCITAVTEPFLEHLPASLSLRRQSLARFQSACNNLLYHHKRSIRYNLPEDLTDAYWRTLICDTATNEARQLTRPAPSHLLDSFMELSEYCGSINSEGIATKKLTSRSSPFLAACEPVWKGRRLCVTQNGFIGLVPWRAEEGDLIHVFLGGGVPFVTRAKSSGNHFLVGECYIHELMDGEALDMDPNNITSELQDIVLE